LKQKSCRDCSGAPDCHRYAFDIPELVVGLITAPGQFKNHSCQWGMPNRGVPRISRPDPTHQANRRVAGRLLPIPIAGTTAFTNAAV